eukprot:13202776-Alexandrium_andersonii.AAC.1
MPSRASSAVGPSVPPGPSRTIPGPWRWWSSALGSWAARSGGGARERLEGAARDGLRLEGPLPKRASGGL